MKLVEIKNPTPNVRRGVSKATGEEYEMISLEVWMQIDPFGYPEKTSLNVTESKNVDTGWFLVPDTCFYLNQRKFGNLEMSTLDTSTLIPFDEDKIHEYMSLQLSEKQLEAWTEQRTA